MSSSVWSVIQGIALGTVLAAAGWILSRLDFRARAKYARETRIKARALHSRVGPEDPISLNSLDEPSIKHFLALDEDSAMRLYSQTTESARVAKLREEETTDGIEGSGRISFGSFGLNGKKNRASRIKETFEPESDPIKALMTVTKQLVDDGSLRHIDLTAAPSSRPLDQLLETLESRAKLIGITIPPEAKVAIHDAWDASRNESADGTLRELRGFVKIKADFLARYDETGDLILEASKESSNRTVGVVVAVRREWLVQATESTIVPRSALRAICFGNVGQWNDEATSLSITPIAIYSA